MLACGMIRHGLILVLGMSCLASCSREESDSGQQGSASAAAPVTPEVVESADAESYFDPLFVGLHREYQLMSMGAGQFTPEYWDTAYTIEGTEEIGGKTFFRQRMEMGGFPYRDDFTAHERKGEDGYYIILEGDEGRTETFRCPLDIKLGDRWTMTIQQDGEAVDYESEVTGTETLELFGVTYPDCLVIEETSKQMTGRYHHCRGIGLVKKVMRFEGDIMVFLLKPLDERGQPPGGKIPAPDGP